MVKILIIIVKINSWKSSIVCKYNLWGQRIRGPGPLYIMAQGLSRGELLLRTTSCSAPHKTPEEKGKLSTGAGQGRKLPTS